MKLKCVTIEASLDKYQSKNNDLRKNKIYHHFLKNRSNMLANRLEMLQNLAYEILERCKTKYYDSISLTSKYYCVLLKSMLNEKKNSCILLFIHDNKLVTDFS